MTHTTLQLKRKCAGFQLHTHVMFCPANFFPLAAFNNPGPGFRPRKTSSCEPRSTTSTNVLCKIGMWCKMWRNHGEETSAAMLSNVSLMLRN